MPRILVFLSLASLVSACDWDVVGDSGDTGSTGTTPPQIPTPEGYTRADLPRFGSEARLIGTPGAPGLALTLDHTIQAAALSGDGQVAWFSATYDWAPDGEKYRVFSMRTDGSELHESELVRPADAPYFNGGFQVRTSGNGEIALLTQYTKDSEDRVVAEFSIAHRGEDFQVVGTSRGDIESLGLAQTVWAELTDAGDAVIFNTGAYLWRTDAIGGWFPFEIDRLEHLQWDGQPPPWNANFGSLDLNISGGEWISHVWLGGDDTAVLTGTSVATYTFEDVVQTDVYPGVQLDDAGDNVAYVVVPYTAYVGEQGGVHRQVEVPVGDVRTMALADGGQVFHAGAQSGGRVMPFFEQVDGGGRVASLTPTWTTFGEVPTPVGQLSDDGQVLLTRAPGPLVHHRGVDAFGAGVDAVFWKEDAEGALTLRAVVHASEPVIAVTAFPLLDEWMPPNAQYGYAEDPTNAIRTGLELLPVDGEVDTYEASFTPRAEASLPFDARFSFRVTVNQGADGKTTSNGYVDASLGRAR